MRISTSMLKKYYKKDISLEHLYNITNEYITEVDNYQKLINSDKVVVGYVNQAEKHPNADKLTVCQVDLGNGITEQIVCGAANVAAGQHVVVAKVGAVLPGDFNIKEANIRGIDSRGMICSLAELGFDPKTLTAEFSEGIYYFPESQPLGSNALEALNLAQGYLELDLTPNRADLLSVLGFAYDLAAATKEKILFIEPEVMELGPINPLTVKIENPNCKRYYARYLDNIKIKPSPMWLQADLIASGIRPINNVVDITNYVLLEYGTPLHAFDANKFATTEIVVKNATDLQEVITLDEQIRILRQDDVVITNGIEPTALGGVMGLLNTMIDNNTTTVILEAASFSNEAIRSTSRRLDLISDSSIRFERGLDETRVRKAINRASELLIEYAEARVYQGISFAGEAFEKPTIIEFDLNEVNKHLGTNLTTDEIKDILSRLNIIETRPNYYLMPTYRNDLTNKADLIEEVARMYGYNNIPTTLPTSELIGGYSPKQNFIINIRKQMSNLGFNEVVNYSLIAENEINLYQEQSKDIVKLLHPMRDDRVVLRHSLVNGLVSNINYHLARQHEDLRFFEVGNVYYTNNEPVYLAGIINGKFIDGTFTTNNLNSSFFVLKGIVEAVLKKYNVEVKTEAANNIEGYHPGVLAKLIVKDETIGLIGKIHPTKVNNAYAFEINLDTLYGLIDSQESYQPFSKYPSISRDLAVVVSKDVPVQAIIDLIKQTTRRYLIDLKVFDIYADDRLGNNNLSIAFRLTFNSGEKTLQTDDADKLIKSLIFRLQKEYQAEIRQ